MEKLIIRKIRSLLNKETLDNKIIRFNRTNKFDEMCIGNNLFLNRQEAWIYGYKKAIKDVVKILKIETKLDNLLDEQELDRICEEINPWKSEGRRLMFADGFKAGYRKSKGIDDCLNK